MKWYLTVIGLVCVILVCCVIASARRDLGEGFESMKMRETEYLKQIIANIDIFGYKPRIINTKYNGIVSRVIEQPTGNKLGYYVVVYDAANTQHTSELYVSSERFPKDASNIQVGRHYDISQNYEMPASLTKIHMYLDASGNYTRDKHYNNVFDVSDIQYTVDNKYLARDISDSTQRDAIIKVANTLRCIPGYDAKLRAQNINPSRTMDDEYLKTIDPILQIIGMGTNVLDTDVSGTATGLWQMTITPEEAIYNLAKYRVKMSSRPVDNMNFDQYGIYPSIRQIHDMKLPDVSANLLYGKLWNLDVSGVSATLKGYNQPTEFVELKGDVDNNSLYPEYHEPAGDLKAKDTMPTYVKDANGKMVAMPWDDATHTSPFYDIHRQTSNYVPDYPESLYLSKFGLA